MEDDISFTSIQNQTCFLGQVTTDDTNCSDEWCIDFPTVNIPQDPAATFYTDNLAANDWSSPLRDYPKTQNDDKAPICTPQYYQNDEITDNFDLGFGSNDDMGDEYDLHNITNIKSIDNNTNYSLNHNIAIGQSNSATNYINYAKGTHRIDKYETPFMTVEHDPNLMGAPSLASSPAFSSPKTPGDDYLAEENQYTSFDKPVFNQSHMPRPKKTEALLARAHLRSCHQILDKVTCSPAPHSQTFSRHAKCNLRPSLPTFPSSSSCSSSSLSSHSSRPRNLIDDVLSSSLQYTPQPHATPTTCLNAPFENLWMSTSPQRLDTVSTDNVPPSFSKDVSVNPLDPTPLSALDTSRSRSHHNKQPNFDFTFTDLTTLSCAQDLLGTERTPRSLANSSSPLFQSQGLPNPSSPHDTTASSEKPIYRKQSESRLSLPELYIRMGLDDNHEEARIREQRILGILKQQGFQLGQRTWIRDTTEKERRAIIDEIYRQTCDDYHYSRELIELIVRRGSYYLMQGRLRRIRRSRKSMENAARLLSAEHSSHIMTSREPLISNNI